MAAFAGMTKGGRARTSTAEVCYAGAMSIQRETAMIVRIRLQPACAALLLMAAAAPWSPAKAQSVAEFYAGKSINVLIGFSAGGGYDAYARMLARHMGRYIPGNPRLLPQNMPGAGSLRAVNYLYSVAPKEGTAIGHFAPGVMFEPLLGRPSAEAGQFDATKFTWLGSVSKEVSVCAFMAATGIKSFADMQTRRTIIAASGGGAESDVFPTVLRNMFNLPLKLVTGYPGGTEMVLAMERHEADGRCGWSWTSLLSRSRALLDNKQINLTLQIALEKDPHPALKDVPLIVDLTDDPQKKAALKLIVSRQAIARPFAAPPGVPADRARALREAFDATMKDPEFLAEARRLSLDVEPVTGAEVEAVIREVYASPPAAVKLAADSMKEIKD
jgi:tripartite-type tricarboxylate transporter receptor subunit TctC